MTEILITSSVLIAALLLLRKLFHNTLSCRVRYALWGLVALRLLVPVSLPAVDFSVLTAARPVERTVSQHVAVRPVYIPVARAPLGEHPAAPDLSPEHTEISEGEAVWVAATDETAVKYKRLSVRTVLGFAWAAGGGIAALFFLTVNVRFWKRMRRSRRLYPVEGCPLRVYLVEEGLSSPCLFGLVRPAVYLTPAVLTSPERLRHVLAHEMTHARHLDHLWTVLRGICLTVYWFDPLVWLVSSAAGIDCELACDEGTLARLGEEERIPYGQTLLSLIPVRRADNPMLAATTMAAGKKQLKERFTRIAQKPRQFAAAVVAAVLLAGIVSACTFTGAVNPERSGFSPETLQEDAGLQALTGEELRWFNESFFNGAGTKDEYGYSVYSICNQFASPWYPYDDVRDIDLGELFYCDGSTEMGAGELQTVLGVQDEMNLPCPAYKLTTEEIDRILTRYTGLTLEQTNKVGLDSFTYSADYDAYYWMHGDTNYCGDLLFLLGTREGSTVKLYQGDGSAWTCVTLEEQEDGGWWFVSNQSCEKPVIPTPMPAGEPDAVMSLDGLEPYEAPAVTLEVRTGDFVDTYENRLANWSIDNHNILLYRTTEGTVNAALRENDQRKVFLSGLGENARMSFFHDLFGHSGFTVSYNYDKTENVRYPGIVTDYYYFGEDGALTLLLRAVDSGVPLQTMALDLDGDGTDELVTSENLFVQRDGRLYQIDESDWLDMVIGADDISAVTNYQWDRYSKCLRVTGYSETADGELRDIERYLYFDGDRLLLYKLEKPCHDHLVDGIDRYVPDTVADAAKDYVEREVVAAQPDGTWRHVGYEKDTPNQPYPQETYDDWRVESFAHPYTGTVGDVTIDVWSFNYELHTTTPEKVVLAGGRYLTEDDWVSPGYPGCDWLFFRVEGDGYTLLWHDIINDMRPGSERFQEYLLQNLERLDVSP